MAVQFWQNMSILEGGLEIAGHGKDFSLELTAPALDTTALNTTGWTSCIAGQKSGALTLNFMQDFVNDGVDETLYANFGGSAVPRSVVVGTADGSTALLMNGITLQYSPLTGNVGELAMGSNSAKTSSGPIARGLLLHPSNVSRTSSSVGTGRQMGAVVAGKKIYAALHVIAHTGTSETLDVKIQSDDNSGFTTATDRITFTQAVGVTSEFKSLAGAITDDYWRISYTIGGSGSPGFTFAVTAGIL